MARVYIFLAILGAAFFFGSGTLYAADELTYGNTEVPVILSRSVWEGDASLARLLTWLPQENHTPPDYALVERVIVHDQGCGDPVACTKNATDFPVQTIQNIYRFHAVSRGWGDIGYNYIIDRQGRVYQGRFGKNGVRGAHLYHDALCQNFNVGSAGILLLGDWRAAPPTEEQLTALTRFTAWFGAVNGFSAGDLVKTSRIFQNPKIVGGTCDTASGDFTATFTGPALLSHGDIEKGNSDLFDFSSLRPRASELTRTFENYAYNDETDLTPYIVLGGGIFIPPQAPDASKIIKIASSQLDLFPLRNVRALADGTLIKSGTSANVYVMEAGQRHSVGSPILFALLGYSRDNVQIVPDRELALYPLGNPKVFPEGTLIQERNKEEVYVSQGGFLRHVSSAALFTKFGFVWQKVVKLVSEDFAEMPRAEALKFPDGVLVKGRSPMVYFVEEGYRRPVGSAALFSALAFRWADIEAMEDYELERYPLGAFLAWPDSTLIRAEGDAKVYFVHYGYKRWVETGEVFLAFGYRWQDIILVKPAELATYADGPLIVGQSDLSWTPPPPPVQTDENEKTGDAESVVAPPAPVPPSTPPPPTPPSTTTSEPLMRVGLASIGTGSVEHPAQEVKVSYNTGARVLKNGAQVAGLVAGAVYSFTPQTGEIWRFEPSVPTLSDGIATVHSYTSLAWDGSNDNRFRGVIEVKAGSNNVFWVINELKIEDYLKGIAEALNEDPSEYARAFAIAARSYAMYYIEKGGKRPEEPFIIRRTPADQLYKGYNFEIRGKNQVAGVTATRGMVAAFNGKTIVAAYSSGAPGPTLSPCVAFGPSHFYCNNPDFAYLNGGVDDPSGIPLCGGSMAPGETCYKYSTCGGAAHCVGIDATGARKMAELGSLGEMILKTYYPGIIIEQRW